MAKELFKRGLRRLKPSKIVRGFENRERIILRDYLAMQRTTLANERTLFSYIRTSLYLVISGIGLLGLEAFSEVIWLGELSFVLAGILLIYGLLRYFLLRRKLKGFYNTIGLDDFEEKAD